MNSLGSTVDFFVRTMAEMLVLFFLVSVLVVWLQRQLGAARLQQHFQGARGYLFAALTGSLTPFCSCSTVPLLTGLLRAGAQFGPCLTFLLTSPLLNPVLMVLMASQLGMQLTLSYVACVLVIVTVAAFLLEKAGFARFVQLPADTSCCGTNAAKTLSTGNWRSDARTAWQQTRSFLPHLVLAVLLGSLIHGMVPAQFFAQYSNETFWLVPLAAVLGIPLYVRASSMLPLAVSLISKGVSHGTVMALTISGAGASLPELILLKRLFRWPLLLAFILVIFSTACVTGWLVDAVLPTAAVPAHSGVV